MGLASVPYLQYICNLHRYVCCHLVSRQEQQVVQVAWVTGTITPCAMNWSSSPWIFGLRVKGTFQVLRQIGVMVRSIWKVTSGPLYVPNELSKYTWELAVQFLQYSCADTIYFFSTDSQECEPVSSHPTFMNPFVWQIYNEHLYYDLNNLSVVDILSL